MKEIITSTAARKVKCEGAVYPYTDKFVVSLKKGRNEVKFKSEAHYNCFIQAVTGFIMGGEITIGEITIDETEKSAENDDE